MLQKPPCVEHEDVPPRFLYKKEFVVPTAGSVVSGQPSLSASSWIASAAVTLPKVMPGEGESGAHPMTD